MSFYIECPHCGFMVEILAINCGIFRHGVLKNNNQQINPHGSKVYCDDLIQKDLIYGCGKPFQLIKKNDTYSAITCAYI